MRARRQYISLLGQYQQILETEYLLLASIPSRARFHVIAERSGIRSQHLPAAPVAATAKRTFRIQWHVPELSGYAILSCYQVAVGNDAGSDPLRDRNSDQFETPAARPNQISDRAQALAALSNSTVKPVSSSSGSF